MLGAIAGNIAGSIYEDLRTKRKDAKLFGRLSLFTDDTMLTVAVAEAYYKDIPLEILRQVKKRLSRDLWDRTLQFYQRYGIPGILKQVDSMAAS